MVRIGGVIVAAFVCLIALVPSATGYTVIGADFAPDHGAPGSRIVVMGLPLAVDCPEVQVWLASGLEPSPPVTSATDPRLTALSGVVRHPPIGAGGIGDKRPGTTFTFRVPAIAAGPYSVFWRCIGGSGSFEASSIGDAAFTVIPGAPTTDVARAGSVDPQGPPVLVVVLAASIGGIAFLRRVAGRDRPVRTQPGSR